MSKLTQAVSRKFKFAALPAAFALSGCFLYPALPPERPHPHLHFHGDVPQAELDAGLPERPQFAIALSGGGVRSAYYSIGALKALYDAGWIDRAEYLSSVSGGGYAAYWLYANQMAAEGDGDGGRLGDAVFAPDDFTQTVCVRMALANSVTYGAMLSSILVGKQREMYRQRLAYRFGAVDPKTDGQLVPREEIGPITSMRDTIRERQWPMPIVNATVYPTKGRDWRDGLIELTPAGVRAEAAGYLPWTEGDSYSLATSASGAAVTRLLNVELPKTSEVVGNRVRAADGGRSENLGAVALIRRGVEHVVVIEAEANPKYEFEAYDNLKTRLKEWGVVFAVPKIEEFLKRREANSRIAPDFAVASGKAQWRDRTGNPHNIRIDYLKMSVGQSLDKELVKIAADPDAPGKELSKKFHEAMGYVDAKRNANYCPQAGATGVGGSETIGPWLDYELARYYTMFRKPKREAKGLPPVKPSTFPHYTTLDQSFYQNQGLAYIALGYRQGKELANIVGEKNLTD